MAEETGTTQRTSSWGRIDKNKVTKQMDATLRKYGMSAVPKDMMDFFYASQMKRGECRQVTWLYEEKEYPGRIFCTEPNGQVKLTLGSALMADLMNDPCYGDEVQICFTEEDADLYEIAVQESLFLENEDDLNGLCYEEDIPIYESVKVTKKDFSVYELHRKYNRGTLILDVDFQRREVWTTRQKCELVESVLMGLPLPVFYLKQRDDSKYVVVDGKQRFTALFEYISDKFALKGLKILTFLNKKKFSDLTGDLAIYQTQLEDYQVYSHVIVPPTPDRILFDIFDRVNRGGTKLNKMEIRNALYHGRGLDMLDAITTTEAFEQATSIRHAKDPRMKGVYLMTRAASFNLYYSGTLNQKGEAYKFNGDTDELQGEALNFLNRQPDSWLASWKAETVADLARIYQIIGPAAFRKEFDASKPINMNMFETLMYFMMLVRGREFAYEGEELRNKISKALKQDEYLSNIGNRKDSMDKIRRRFEVMDRLAGEVCK